jgi:hypothetical protein
MKLSAPKKFTWWIATIIVLVVIAAKWFVAITFVSANAFVVLLVAFAILWLGTYVKGL